MWHPNMAPPFHHRGHSFKSLVRSLDAVLHEKLDIPSEFDLLYLTGSGSLGLEACLYSATRPVTPLFTEGEFGMRLADLTFTHNKHGIGTEDVCFVQYETSESLVNRSGWKSLGCTIVDCVSSFPYHQPAFDADVWVTVSGKQLGAAPGVCIVAVHKRVWDDGFFVKPVRPYNNLLSYLDLGRYYLFKKCDETPNTPAIGILQQLYGRMVQFDLGFYRNQIRQRWAAVCDIAGFPTIPSAMRGKDIPIQDPPVYTFNGHLPERVVSELGLYGKRSTQLFLYNGDEFNFEILLETLKELQHEMPGADFWWARQRGRPDLGPSFG